MEKGLVSVDWWTEGSQVYFPMHLHSDLTQGLSSGWAKDPLFCSRLTFIIFPSKFSDFDFSLLRVLNIGVWHSFSLVSSSSRTQIVIQVMAIDAYHCLGLGLARTLANHASFLGSMTFTTKTSLTRVRAVPRYSFSIETLEGLNKKHPTIGIMPCGLPRVVKRVKGDGSLFGSFLTSLYKGKSSANGRTSNDKLNGNVGSVERFHVYIYSVPYSDYSCFKEIQEFIELVQPTSMKGIVSSSSFYADPLYYFGRLCEENQLSEMLHCKHGKKEGGKTVVAVQTKSYSGNHYSTGATKKRRKVRLSRVKALRRLRFGARVEENDCSD